MIVADRFADSSVAYQGGARGLGTSHVLSLTDTVIDGLWPDLTILLRVDPEVGLGRADGEDRLEAEGLELQRAVAEAYEEIAIIASDRVVALDASGGPTRSTSGSSRSSKTAPVIVRRFVRLWTQKAPHGVGRRSG